MNDAAHYLVHLMNVNRFVRRQAPFVPKPERARLTYGVLVVSRVMFCLAARNLSRIITMTWACNALSARRKLRTLVSAEMERSESSSYRERMRQHVARQDENFATGAFEIERLSGLYQSSRIFKELFSIFCLLESGKNFFRPKNVLEVGCGLGNMTGCFRASADRVLAIDMSETAISEARRRNEGLGGVEFLVHDGTRPLESQVVAGQRYDIIYVREFHPFTRRFYNSEDEAYEAHKATCAEYLNLLNEGGYLLIWHAVRNRQCIQAKALNSPLADLVVESLDLRLFTIMLVLTQNRVAVSKTISKLLQPIFRLAFGKSTLFMLKRNSRPGLVE